MPRRGHGIALLLAGLFLAAHPFPAAMNGLGALAAALLGADLGWAQALLLTLAVVLAHATIGSMNDVADREDDERTAPHKPIVRGWVTPGHVLALSLVAAAISFAIAQAFGSKSLVVACVVLAAGMAYNFGLKGTVLSVLPYAIFIPSAVVWPFAAANRLSAAVLLTYPVGAVLAVGLNVANSIPDLETDAKVGVRGLAHRLGPRLSAQVVLSSFGATYMCVALIAAWASATALAVSVLGAGATSVGLLALAYRRASTRTDLRYAWGFAALLAAGIAAAWALTLRHMLGTTGLP